MGVPLGATGPQLLRVSRRDDLRRVLAPVARDRPVLVLVGGAGGMGDGDRLVVASLLENAVAPTVVGSGAVVVDGGTDSGVMRAMGETRVVDESVDFLLIGVVAAGTVVVPGEPRGRPDAAGLEARHTHIVLVPGRDWGDESSWIAEVADVIAGPRPSVTLLVNGGEIAYDDATRSVARGRPVVVMAGSGRTAEP